MKKLWFVFLFTLTGLFAFSQYSPVYVSGSVKDVNGNPVFDYPVVIYADSSSGSWNFTYYAKTDSFGQFSITITPPAGLNQGFYAYTYDCKQNIIDTFFTNATQQIRLSFTLCTFTPPYCKADFFYYPDSSGIYTYNFIDNSSGTPTNYYWSFGDSSFSILRNPTHTFKKGIFNVCLIISDSVKNCSDTYCSQVYINDSTQTNRCSTSFTYYDSNLIVYFSGYSKSAGLLVVGYTWDFGDGSHGTGQNPVHTYSSTAAYTVCLTTVVIDSKYDTCVSSFCDYINPGQQPAGSIWGFVRSNIYSVDKALVYLIKYNPKDSTLTAVDSVYAMDSGGVAVYYFANITYGDYLVKAALTSASANYSHCLPTYFGDVLYWDQATTVSINPKNQYTSADIEMVTGTNPGGPGFIGGKTSKGANIWILNSLDPVANVEILLLDQSGNPISYNFSKTSGDFGFNSLAFGTYQIYAEMPGRKTTPAFVTIDAQHPSVNDVQIVISEKSIKTSVNPDISISISNVGNIYPNPVLDKFNLDFNIKKAIVIDVQITDNLGQVSNTKHFKLTTGRNTITLGTTNLPQGIYTLNIKSADGANIFKNFTIIR